MRRIFDNIAASVASLLGGGKRKETFSIPLSTGEGADVKQGIGGRRVRRRVGRSGPGKHNGRHFGAFGKVKPLITHKSGRL